MRHLDMIKRFGVGKKEKSCKHPRFEYGCISEGEWYFQLKTSDGSLLFHSTSYPSEEECRSALEEIKLNSCMAEIIRVKSLEQY